MKIKRFFAKDMKTALLQVKEELGVDAVIMSNKKVAGGVEIVAAVDSDTVTPKTQVHGYNSQPRYRNAPSAASSGRRELEDDRVQLGQRAATTLQKPQQKRQSSGQRGSMTNRFANLLKQYTPAQSDEEPTREDSLSSLLQRQAKEKNTTASHASSRHGENGPVSRWEEREEPHKPQLDPSRYERRQKREEESQSPQDFELMKEDINSIRRLLEHQVSGLMWQEVERREPLRAMLIKRLSRMGLSLELADQLACYIPEDTPPPKAWRALLGLVSDQIPVVNQDILKRGGVVALLGPTGVGKTTTVAKLAARAAMEYGSDNVALVTTDTYRIGAHEQLAIYGRIMGCPVKVAKDSNELADVVQQLRNRRLILVDTAGMGQRDVRLSEQLDTLMQDRGGVIKSYLVLPATAQRKVLQETIDHFRRIPLSGCIMTKLDESLSLGEFVSVVVENALPVAYIANGQRVPEDIVIAQPKYMVAKANELLEKSADNEPHYWSSDSERI
ncbi:Flagellar biosynthesis protein FlhF [Vibrio ruber DSM 16370]|uniref:Flagellar biosynthesis protein FlhF n=1 Tax=Vibrio ruber (strain DSM 16370 / JCM 11486 / BCRC 17186 / CECT 7878 / LMG 23124 / VR1) TaxID=1123498 RepID=A0A1R4LEK8_VIBR1|nr:flagellar biosynthesis protein FlhF [Vibrio ruber]SJN54724.1 Flagellar biosynthesis protein FlhF [Vibrio ruber DSM 16370]